MRIASVIGSPHGMDGNTGPLLEAVLDGARDAGDDVRVELYDLSELDVAPCRACDACHRTGECAIRDDFPRMKQSFLDADAVVLASPNYIRSVSAQTKAVLDRCCGLIHTQALEGTYGAAVVTSGGEESESVVDYTLRALQGQGCWMAGGVGAAAHQMQQPGPREAALGAGRELGADLVRCVEEGVEFPEQMPRKREFRRRMIQLVAANREDWTYEYEYWQAKGEL